jgi:hypothetical protein
MIFAREITDPLTSLVKKIDAVNQKEGKKMMSFVVFLNDKEGIEKELKELATKENLKQTVLAKDSPAGPKGYDVAKDADVTVVLYVNRNVKSNHAFKKGELNQKAVDEILADMPKILEKK